ncbi:MAG TPA: DUF3325 domain-containing protein [Steroidobacteraceae bacterium]|nr:DUF3325 domain-containing protein [Steroidobacteraceae bacterium]
MPDALLLAAALACTVIGMGWLSLAMDVHWIQVRATRRSPRMVIILRVLGAASLAASLVLCLLADTATMAALVWMMLLAVAAVTIALVLSRKPALLAPLVAAFPQSP